MWRCESMVLVSEAVALVTASLVVAILAAETLNENDGLLLKSGTGLECRGGIPKAGITGFNNFVTTMSINSLAND